MRRVNRFSVAIIFSMLIFLQCQQRIVTPEELNEIVLSEGLVKDFEKGPKRMQLVYYPHALLNANAQGEFINNDSIDYFLLKVKGHSAGEGGFDSGKLVIAGDTILVADALRMPGFNAYERQSITIIGFNSFLNYRDKSLPASVNITVDNVQLHMDIQIASIQKISKYSL